MHLTESVGGREWEKKEPSNSPAAEQQHLPTVRLPVLSALTKQTEARFHLAASPGLSQELQNFPRWKNPRIAFLAEEQRRVARAGDEGKRSET